MRTVASSSQELPSWTRDGAARRARAGTRPDDGCLSSARRDDSLFSVTSDPLVDDLARLHRGRGLRSPALGEALGPTLRATLGMDEIHPGPQAVLEQLQAAIASLPQDLQVAFLHGLGVRSSEAFLQERVEAAAQILHVTPRTVRRRLAEANTLVARSLRDPSLTGAAVLPVRLLTQQVTTDLRRPVIRLTSAKDVLRRRDGEVILAERFGVPGQDGPDPPRLTVGGADLLGLTPVSSSVWEARIRLPQGDPGTKTRYSLTVEQSDTAQLSPFTVVVPMQLLNQCSVTVHFGAAHPVAGVREVRDALPVTLYERPVSTAEPATVPPSLTMTVDRPQLGLAFGYAWAWPSKTG